MQIHQEKVSNGEPAIGHSCILWWDKKTERDLFNKEGGETGKEMQPLCLTACSL